MIDLSLHVAGHYIEAELLGHEIVGLFLQGSQNYGLDYVGSDVDTKAIVLPSFNDMVINRKPVSTTHVRANNEHIDLKDIRLMFECFRKQNINFVEILFTPHRILNPKYEVLIAPLFENRERIARYNNYAAVSCMAGMSGEKLAALTHPYPATMDKIERYGYDPKQLHHIVRLNEFIKRYIEGVPYAECLFSNQRNYLMGIKVDVTYSLEEAQELACKLNSETKQIQRDYMEAHPLVIDTFVDELFEDILTKVMRRKFIEEIGAAL